MKFCSKCGTQLEPEMAACPNCGKPLASAPEPPVQSVQPAQTTPSRFCPHCGSGIPNGAAVCPDCGTPVSGNEPVAVMVGQLKTNRSLMKYILLSLITFNIYGLVVMSTISEDINTIIGARDGKRTMHFCLMLFLIGPLTLGIGTLVWFHKISNRIGNELIRRGIPYSFSADTFWGWNVLGSLIVVGPMVYCHKLFRAMNLLAEHFNYNG